MAVVSASLFPLILATPANWNSNANGASDITDGPLMNHLLVSVTADQVLDYLNTTKQITWAPAGNGQVTDIPDDMWVAGINGATKAMGSSDSSLARRDLYERSSIASIAGYAASAACYGSGSYDMDSTLTGLVTGACDGLVDSTLPPLYKNVIRLWASPQIIDGSGAAAYVKFTAKLLTDGFQYDTSLCQDALNSFGDYCQDGNGKTQGGKWHT